VKVSYTTKPVMQDAEVEVKSESINGVHSPDLEENGNDKRAEPMSIKIAKLITSNLAGAMFKM